jgi:hypothetical protein
MVETNMIHGRLADLSTLKKTMIVVFAALIYFGSFRLNQILFSDFLFTHRVHWIYLPGGLRLLLVLLFFELGVAGIFLGALMMNYGYFYDGDHVFALGVCVLVALSAWLTRYLSLKWFDLDVNLMGLSLGVIFKMAVLLSFLSSIMLQSWFYLNGKTENFFEAVSVMALGKFTGTLIVLSLFSVALKFLRALNLRKGRL